jgi:hypothetical protein
MSSSAHAHHLRNEAINAHCVVLYSPGRICRTTNERWGSGMRKRLTHSDVHPRSCRSYRTGAGEVRELADRNTPRNHDMIHAQMYERAWFSQIPVSEQSSDG